MNEKGTSHRRLIARLLLTACVVAALIALAVLLPLREWLDLATDLAEDLGVVGYALFLGLYVVGTLFGFASTFLTVAGGAVYGLALGSGLVFLGANVGATFAFLISRYLARGLIAARMENNAKFKAVDEAVGQSGFKIVFLTRLSPIFPMEVLNYVYGLTKVGYRDFALASIAGLLPGTIMYVFIGATAKAAVVGSIWGAHMIPMYIGLAVTMGVALYVARVVKRAIRGIAPQ